MTLSHETTQAGGGVPAAQTAHDTISTFTPVLIKYIQSLHRDLATKHQWGSGRNDVSSFMLAFPSLSKEAQTDLATGKKSTFETLLAHLASPNGSVQEPLDGNDLSHPFPEYFISSSHNTYLTGNQLSSDSSVEAYRNVLLRGCRSVEVDVWDGKEPDEDHGSSKEHRGFRARLGLKGHRFHHAEATHASESEDDVKVSRSSSSTGGVEPRVLHGYTLTKEISFRAVCETIRDSAFVNSDLPVIISLEIHTNMEQQAMMVCIMREVWGEMLVVPPSEEELAHIDVRQLPSPADLRNRILIKVKYTPPEVAKTRKLQEAAKNVQTKPGMSSSESSDDDVKREKKPKKPKILPMLSGLGVYMRSYHFKSFDQPEAKFPAHIFSLSERTLLECHETVADALLSHNRDFLMRAYPRGMRFSSSNLNPSLFWRQGVQMAALNWQECDKGVMLNEAMFAGTGGFVLKPSTYRYPARPSDLLKAQSEAGAFSSRTSQADTNLTDLNIEFFAAQNIPLCPEMGGRPFRPYIKCTLHVETIEQKLAKERAHPHLSRLRRHSKTSNRDDDDDADKLKARSRTYHGQAPDLGREVLSFNAVAIDEEALCFLRIKVMDDVQFGRDELAGWACIRIDRIGEGVRTLRLFDASGQASDGIMLVRVSKQASKQG